MYLEENVKKIVLKINEETGSCLKALKIVHRNPAFLKASILLLACNFS